jgi:hypothetical protein
MPKIPSQPLCGPPEQHRDTREILGLQQPPYGVLNMFYLHRDVPPIEDMANRPADSAAQEIWQGGVDYGSVQKTTLRILNLLKTESYSLTTLHKFSKIAT